MNVLFQNWMSGENVSAYRTRVTKRVGPDCCYRYQIPVTFNVTDIQQRQWGINTMKYDNPAQSWFRTQDPLNTRRCNSSWSVSLQDLPCRMNEINFYINEEISMTTRTDDTPFKSVKHRFATLPPSRSKTVEKFSCFKKIRLNIIYTLISVEFITTRNRNKISLSTK